MAEDLRKLVQNGINKGYSLEKIQSDFANAGWSQGYLNNIPVYYNEFKKKSLAGPKDAGVLPSKQADTRFSSESQLQQDKYSDIGNIPLSDPLLKKKDGLADSLYKVLNQAERDADNANKYVPQINKLWNDYASIERGSKETQNIFDERGRINKLALASLNASAKRNADRVQEEAKALAKDDGVVETAFRGFYGGLLSAADYFMTLVDPDTYDDQPDAPSDIAIEAKKQSERAQKASYGRKLLDGYTEKQIEDGFSKNFADGNYSTALGLFGRDLLELLPQNAVGFIPYVGLPLMAASAGGQGWQAVKDDNKYSTLEKFLYAPLVGVAEYATEKLFGMDRRLVQKGLSEAFGKTIKTGADIPKKELGDMLFGNLPKAVRAPMEEGLEEGVVNTFTQTLDKIMAGKPYDPVEIAESVILGAGAGSSTYGLVRGASAILQTPVFSDVYKITNNVNKINELLSSEDIIPEEREILTNRLNQFKTQLNQLRDEASDYYKPFSQEDKQRTLELNQAITKGMNTFGSMKTAEAKAEVVNTIKQSLAEKAQIEQKYDSTQKQQVPSPVVQGAQPGGVPVQGTGTETPQAGGVLQVPSQQEEKVAEAAKQPNVGFRPTKASLTSQTLPQILSNLKSYVESIPEETLQKFETTRQSITNGFESVANVISSFAKEGLNVEIEAINTEDEWNKATMDPTTGKPEKLSRGLYYQRGQEGAPSKIILFAPALLGNTVYHEGIHEIVPQAFGQEGINKVAKALASGIKRDPGLNAKFGNFLSQYEQGDKNEELLAELGAMVAAGDIDVEITKSLATRFMEAVASVLGAVGIKMAPNSSQLSEALLSYSQKLGAGAKLDIQKTTETKEEGDKKGPKRQAVGLRTKEESLAEFGFPVGDKVTNIRQVGAALEKRQQKKYIKIAKNDTSDKAKDIISNYMVDEVIFELESLGESSAKGWYGEKFQKALDLLSESIPSLKDKGNRNLFTMLVAITSDGQKVINNFTYAISLYNSYLKDGVVSDKFNFGGDRNSGMKINVGNINRLIKQYGNDFVAINDFLLQTDSYGNIKKKYNIKKSDYKVTTTMPISAGVFGPKLGAFFANLSGQENYLTMDRWWSRTFNRYRGILLPTVKEQGKQKFLNAIGKPNISNNAFLKEVKKYADSYIKKKYKNGTAIEKAANTIYKAAFVELNDKPFNAGDRDMMIETTQVAQEKLKKAGYDLSMADIQAILWYFEKRLYAEIQSKKSAMDVDYSNAVAKLIEEKKDLSFLPNEVSKIVNVKESEDEYVDAISSPSSNIIQLDEAVDLAAVDKATETINNAQKRKAPKRQGFEGKQSATFVRELDIAITPATTERKFDKVTARIKSLSEKYDRLVKESEKGIDNSEEINNVASQILDAARKQLAARISKVKGASVKFDDDFRGLYNNVFEPSFNLKLRLTPQSNENEVSQILNEFAERYTQDAFIVETASEESEDFRKQLGENVMPLGDYDEKTNMSHFPQLYAEFTSPLSDKELNELSLSLREGGIDGFSLNKKELKITIFPFLTEEQEKLSEDEQRRIKKEYYDEQISSARKAMANVSRVGRDVKSEVRFRKSTYKGAKSTEGATRQYDRDNFLKAHKEGLTKYELLAKEFNKLRLEEIELSKKKEKLPKDKQKRYDEIRSVIQPIIQDTIALNEPFYKEAKREIERIASSVSRNLSGAFVSRFNIKRPERASIKVMRWYNSDIEDLGDGARVNIIVDNEQQADRLFNEIDKKNPSKNPDRERRVNETTDLGYPKRLIEMDTKNGFIGEIQIMTPEGYLAKDGVDYFDDNQQDFARKRLKEVQDRLGWAIPDGIGHYFYEINRDENINDELRERAKALSLSYYKAFTNPSFKLSESEFTKELAKFKEDVDKADKSTWDEGNSGKSPKTLDTYLEESGQKAPKRQDISKEDEPIIETTEKFGDYDLTSNFQKPKAQRIPQKTQTAYKLFRVKKSEPGKLFPLYVLSDKEVPVGEWIEASMGGMVKDTKGNVKVKSSLGPLAMRPGWHSGDAPFSTHIGNKVDKKDKSPSFRADNTVWAEVEVGADVDWQQEANARAEYTKDGKLISKTAHITDQIPALGFYKYKTNSNMTGNWLISGEMKVNRVLTDEQVAEINKKAGVEDLPRLKPMDWEAYGFEVSNEEVKPISEGPKPKRQAISKAQGPSLIPAVYSSLLQESTKNSDGTNTPPYTLQQWLTMMTPYLSAQTATAIYNGVVANNPPSSLKVPSIDDAYDASKKLLEAEKDKRIFTWANARKYFIDRQSKLKSTILAAGMKNAYNLLVNRAGSGARAAYFFSKQEKAIYEGLSKSDIEALDKIIMLRRIAEIDKNFDQRGETRPIHPNRINLEAAQINLAEKRNQLGNSKFNELNDRADKYFDAFRSLLESMYDEGLVSEDLYMRLRDLDYQPRVFLQHVFEMDELSMRDINLTANQIKRIKEGSDDEIMFGSRFLLAVYSKSTFSRIARNKVNSEIAKAATVKGNESWISEDPKKQFDEVTYFDNGLKKSFYIKSNLKGELDDVQRYGTIPANTQKYIGFLSGSYLLKLLATRANPLFVFRNVPRDYLHVLFFTNVYDKMSMPMAMYRLAGDAIRGAKGKIQEDKDFKDFIEYGGGMDYLSTEGKEGMMTNRNLVNKTIEKLGSVGELSEIAFRLGMYKRFMQESLKDFDGTPSEQELQQLKVQAVTKAREMIDFAQGGVATKNLETALPYINSAFQGFRVSTAYIKNNPKQFAIKIGQLTIGLAALALYNSIMGDDDMENIPDEVKRKYFIIMTPFTEEKDGKTVKKYIKIAKTQQLAPFIAGLELGLEFSFIAPFMGREPKDNKEAYEYASKGIAAYFPKNPSKPLEEVMTSIPLFSALSAYKMNYDTYKERMISLDYTKVLPADEDYADKNVPYFYKAIGQSVGAGPKRLQVATEKFITSPYSSMITMAGYSIMDGFSRAFEVKGPGGYTPEEQDKISNGVLNNLGLNVEKVFVGKTDPDWKVYNKKQDIELINLEAASERKGLKLKAKELGGDYFIAKEQGDSKGMADALNAIKQAQLEVRKKAVEEKNRQDYDYFTDALKANMRFGVSFPQEYNDITYATDNNARARIIAIKDRTMTEKELIEYLVDYKRTTGKSLNVRAILQEYNKVIKDENK